MGWFDEQIKLRKLSDQEVFEDSFMQMASVILGNRISSKLQNDIHLSQKAVDDILKYFHYKPTSLKEDIKDFDESLEYILRPHGIMRRNIKLSAGWYKDAFGPILAFFKEGDIPVAILPRTLYGYYYIDPSTGKKVNINAQNEELLQEDALCFYKPLPLKKLGIKDLILYLKDTISLEDIFLMATMTIILSLVGLIMPRLTKILTGPVLNSHSLGLLLSIAILIESII